MKIFLVEMIESEMSEPHLEFISTIGDQAAFWAIEANCLNLVKYLQKFYDYDKIRYNFLQYPMLHIAVQCNAIKILEYLLECKLNLEVMNWNRETALLLAYQNLKILKLLVAHGANLHEGHELEVQRKKSYFDRILDDANESYSDQSFDNIILHRAIQHGSNETILYLIDQNVNIHHPDVDGLTPVHQAAVKNRLDILKILVSKGARLKVSTRLKNTTLHLAAESGSKEVVKYLLRRNFDMTSKNIYGKTALDLAKKARKKENVKILTSNKKSGDETLNSTFDKLKI